LFNYDPYDLDTSKATPLTDNVKVNGTISSSVPVALYSINVTSGTKYHLWWDDSDTNWEHMDVRVRGYNSNGSMFFDTDTGNILDWDNYYSFTAASTDTVYIMVYPLDRYETGTFVIVYNTTGNQPIMSVSLNAPSSVKSGNIKNNIMYNKK